MQCLPLKNEQLNITNSFLIRLLDVVGIISPLVSWLLATIRSFSSLPSAAAWAQRNPQVSHTSITQPRHDKYKQTTDPEELAAHQLPTPSSDEVGRSEGPTHFFSLSQSS
jgi:hypothetical protein